MERMDQTNQGSSSSSIPPIKRKRGRPPRSDEVLTLPQPNPPAFTDENLIGRMVSGVVEGSFEAGYFLNVKVADTDKHFKGIVFLPGKVTPLTPATDLFPHAREVLPSLNQHTPTTQSKNQTDIHPMSDEVGGSVAIDETNLSMDTEMKDVGGSSAVDKLTEKPESQTLSLMPQFDSDDAPKEYHTVLSSEACGATPETSRKQVTGSSSTLSLDLFQNETKRSGTKDEESPEDAETRGVEGKPVSPVDDVPEELQLELGNMKMSATATATETIPDQSTS